MDIDPNNIEEISILRGAAATALYGSRAAVGRDRSSRPSRARRVSRCASR